MKWTTLIASYRNRSINYKSGLIFLDALMKDLLNWFARMLATILYKTLHKSIGCQSFIEFLVSPFGIRAIFVVFSLAGKLTESSQSLPDWNHIYGPDHLSDFIEKLASLNWPILNGKANIALSPPLIDIVIGMVDRVVMSNSFWWSTHIPTIGIFQVCNLINTPPRSSNMEEFGVKIPILPLNGGIQVLLTKSFQTWNIFPKNMEHSSAHKRAIKDNDRKQ